MIESRTGRGYLPYGRQVIEEDDIEAVVDVLRGDWLTTGPNVEAFETALAAQVGAEFAVIAGPTKTDCDSSSGLMR